MQNFIEADQDVPFNIPTPLRHAAVGSKTLPARPWIRLFKAGPASAAKELLEEIAKPCSAKMEFKAFRTRFTRATSLPAWRRLESTLPVPICSEGIVLLALLRVA